MNDYKRAQAGSAAGVFLVFMTLGFILSTAFGIWAFVGMQDNKTNLDKKVAAATEVAVQKAESDKDAEFAELEKNPFRKYTGSQTYGTLSFEFPKSWNAYVEEKERDILLNFYAHPGVIPGLGDNVNFAFRAEIIDTSYQKKLQDYERLQKDNKVTVEPYRPKLVDGVLGVIVKGKVYKEKQGVLVVLPQRDKTFMFWTESPEYEADFTKILETLTFIP